MTKITWLHVSDFHFRASGPYDRDVVLRALVKSVRQNRKSAPRVDLIFATGDVAHSGNRAEYEAASTFFDALVEAAGLQKDRLFVIPGNHDVDWERSRGLARTLPSVDEADIYLEPGKPNLHIVYKQQAFFDWYNRYFDGIRTFPDDSTCGPVDVVTIGSTRVGILSVNTALFAYSDDDRMKLWVGRLCLDTAIKKLNALRPTLKIALTHHPLDWLNTLEARNIENKLEENVQFILRGHLHESDAKSVVNSNGQTIHLAAGAAYQDSKWPKKALYVSVNRQKSTIHPICYSSSPHEAWTLDTSLFPSRPKYEMTLSFRSPAATVARVRHSSAKTKSGAARSRPKKRLGRDEHVIKIVVKKDTFTELLLLDTGKAYVIDYSPIAGTVRDHNIDKKNFEKLVEREFLGHRIMLEYEYVHVGIPLLGGMTVFVTKRLNHLTLEFLMTLKLPGPIGDGWDRLSHAYRVALRLPYRKAHERLLEPRERERSLEAVANLVHEASSFFFETARAAPRARHPEYTNQKKRAEVHLTEAERIANDDSTILDSGGLAMNLEMAISNVHKMMIYFGTHWEMKDWTR